MADSPPLVISPPADATSFTVNGMSYTATDGLSVARLRIFDRLSLEFGADLSLRGMMSAHDEMSAAYSALDMPKLGHLIYQRSQALNLSGANRLKEVEICGLFFNAPDEDPTTYDYAAMQAKCYTAWGAVAGGFFTPAAFHWLTNSKGPYARLPAGEASSNPDTIPAP